MYLIPEVFLFLIYIKVIHEKLYNDILLKRFSIDELQNNFFIIVKSRLNEDNERILMWLEAYLVLYYNNFINKNYRKNKIYEYDSTTRENKLLIHSVINKNRDAEFLSIFNNIDRERNSDLDLNHFFKRINLTESLVG